MACENCGSSITAEEKFMSMLQPNCWPIRYNYNDEKLFKKIPPLNLGFIGTWEYVQCMKCLTKLPVRKIE